MPKAATPTQTRQMDVSRLNFGKRWSLAACLGLGLTMGLSLTGCDTQATQKAEAQEQIDLALKHIEQASLGFVPAEEGKDAAADVQAYRQKALEQAVTPLKEAVAKGSPSQATSAAGLLADIAGSRAFYDQRLAHGAFETLSSRSQSLVNYLVVLDSAQARVNVLDNDLTNIVAQYESGGQASEAQARELRRSIETLSDQLEKLQQRASDIDDEIAKHVDKADSLKESALTAEGMARFDLEDAISQAQRAAAEAGAQRDIVMVQVNKTAQQIDSLKRRAEAFEGSGVTLLSQADASRDRQEELTQALSAAEKDRDQAFDTLLDDLDQLSAAFNKQVSEPMVGVQQRLLDAMNDVESVMKTPGLTADQKLELNMQLLSLRIKLAHVLTQHASVTMSFGSTVQLLELASDRMPEEGSQAVVEAFDNLKTQHDDLIQSVKDQSAQALMLLEELEASPDVKRVYGNEAERVLSNLGQMAETLDGYALRVEQAAF